MKQGFISYARKNRTRVERLRNNLRPMEINGEIEFFDDHDIGPGTEWDQEISLALARSDVILLCVSDYFLASRYIYDKELRTAFRKHDAGTARVIPVIMTYCSWHDLALGGRRLGDLQAVPDGGRPIEAWRPVTRGYTRAADQIRAAVRSLPD